MSRQFRAVAAVATVLALLFAQAATAAFACPVVDPVAMARMEADVGNDGGLCEHHCAAPKASLEAAKPSPAAMPAGTQALLPAARVARVQRHTPVRAAPLSVAGPAPPLIRFTVLRI